MNILYGIICATLFGAIIFISKYVDESKKNSLSMALYNHVKWCVEKGTYYRDFHLKHYIFRTYSEIESNYQILDKQDIKTMEIIIKMYQESLTQRFFYDNLSTDKDVLSLSDEEYFFFTLLCYLENNNYKADLDGYCMYELISKTEYGSYGATLYDATYSLTNFGLVYQMLFYAVTSFCENNENIRKLLKYNISHNIKHCIDTQEIQISRL